MKNTRRFFTPFIARRGLSSMVVIGFTVVIFILFGRLITMLKQEAYMASHFHKRGILANLADGGASVGLNVLELQFADPKSETFKTLSDPKNVDPNKILEFDIYPKGPYPLKCLEELVAKYPGTSLTVRAKVKYLRPFPNKIEGLTTINKEKIGQLEVISSAQYDTEFTKYKQVVREGREIKITCQALPVFSRFSFFLQEANKTSKPEKYGDLEYSKEGNVVDQSEDGKASGQQPLVIASGMSGPFGDIKRRGWVFLGGGEKPKIATLVTLAGGKTNIGEAHHLNPDLYQNEGQRDLNGWQGYVRPLSMQPNNVIQSNEFAHPDNDPKNLTAGQLIGTVGLFDSGHCKELWDLASKSFQSGGLNLAEVIKKLSNAKEADGAFSNCFRLFGAADGVKEVDTNRMPGYVIMGNVWRGFTQIGCFQFDDASKPTSGWEITGFWPFLDSEGFKQLYTKFFDNQDPNFDPDKLPLEMKNLYYAFNSAGLTNHWGNPAGSKPNLDEAYKHYLLLMSWLPIEPYANSSSLTNALIDAKIAPDGAKPKDWGASDEVQWGSVLPSKDKAKNLMEKVDRDYTKTLNAFALPDEGYFKDRETIRYKGENATKDFESYFKEHLKGGKLTYGKFIVIEAEKVTIPDIDEVEKGGVIVVKGDIDIGKLGKDVDLSSSIDEKCDALFTVVSLGGTIRLNGKNVNASVVALGQKEKDGPITGTIENNETCSVFGNLVTRELDPAKVAKKGGLVTYNPALSPETDGSYLTNDHAFCINQMPKINFWEIKAE